MVEALTIVILMAHVTLQPVGLIRVNLCHRAMHYVTAWYCYRPSVRPSVCLSVTLRYRDSRNWVTSKIIAWGLRSSEPQHQQSSSRGHTKNSSAIGVGSLFSLLSRKPAISVKRGKVGARLLLMTNRKLHTRYRLVPKSTTLDDLERPLRTLFQIACVFGAHHENLNEDRPTLLAAKM